MSVIGAASDCCLRCVTAAFDSVTFHYVLKGGTLGLTRSPGPHVALAVATLCCIVGVLQSTFGRSCLSKETIVVCILWCYPCGG
jgi:hypothetical protein